MKMVEVQMNHKLIGIIFLVLFLLSAAPFPFTQGEQIYLFGWLPLALMYWWILMVLNLIFVLWVCRTFVKSSKKKEGES